MELLILAIVCALPISFIVWTLRAFAHSELALLNLAPLSMLIIIVLMLNVLEIPPALEFTHQVPINETSTVAGNVTTTTTTYDTITDKIPIPYVVMQVINFTMGAFSLVVAFLTLRRISVARQGEE